VDPVPQRSAGASNTSNDTGKTPLWHATWG
jgi:hypothetical protein